MWVYYFRWVESPKNNGLSAPLKYLGPGHLVLYSKNITVLTRGGKNTSPVWTRTIPGRCGLVIIQLGYEAGLVLGIT